VRVVVASPKVSVFVADATEPSLVVSQLSHRAKGRVGLWVGNGSDGDFANLILTPCPPLPSGEGARSSGLPSPCASMHGP